MNYVCGSTRARGFKEGMVSVVEFLSSVGEIESLELIGYNLFEDLNLKNIHFLMNF